MEEQEQQTRGDCNENVLETCEQRRDTAHRVSDTPSCCRVGNRLEETRAPFFIATRGFDGV